MTEERTTAELETMEIIKATRTGDITEAIMRASAMSYARGIRDGVKIAKKPDDETAA